MDKKKYRSKTTVLPFLIILILSFLFYVNQRKVKNYTLTEYEKNMISYFKEVALQSEYDDNPQKIIKWEEPMTLFIAKDGEYKNQIEVIKKTVIKINELATDGFKIKLGNNILKCNAILYLSRKERVSELDSSFYKMLNDGIDYEISGLAYAEFSKENYNIKKVLIYINTEESMDIQESTILEEITQSIGLPFDPMTYPNSIFYENKSQENINVKEYTKMDADLVRLLYHPKMKPGLNSKQTVRVIKRILMIEAENL